MEYFSLGWMCVEAFCSFGVGLLVGSLALVAFGTDSLVELISASVVLRHLKADVDGSRGRGERTARFSSILLFSLLPILGFGAVYAYLAGIRPDGSPLGIAIAIGAVVVMPYLWFNKRKVGKETNCLPLKIDSVESATCFLMSLTLLGGLLAVYLLGLWWADYVATGVILAFVGKEALESYSEARLTKTSM